VLVVLGPALVGVVGLVEVVDGTDGAGRGEERRPGGDADHAEHPVRVQRRRQQGRPGMLQIPTRIARSTPVASMTAMVSATNSVSA
jgi:hypothetical protein